MEIEKLTIQEEEAMLSVWQLKGGFVKEILENLKGAAVPYTTLASTIKNLEKKRYEPVISEEEYNPKRSIKGDT